MKMTKRLLAIVMSVVTLISVMGIAVEAAEIYVSALGIGYMVPTNTKGTKNLSTVKLYGDYDYINFYINAKKNDGYFAYEIYADKDYTKLKDSGAVACDKGKYNIPAKIKLKGEYSSKTYYLVTYAAYIYSDGSVDVDRNSLKEFEISVKRSASFDDKVVVLKETKNTTKGVYITWSKLSGTSKYYIYRRSITGTKWTRVGTVSSSKSSFTDTSVKNKNGNYVYSVKGVNKKGTASRYLYFGLTALFAKTPTMKSIAVAYNNAIEVKWNSTSSKAKYNIMRKEGDGSWKTIKSNYSGTSYKDTTAKNGKKYTYSVKAVLSTSYGKATSSYYANSDMAVTYLKAPTLTGITPAETGMTITWDSVSGAKGYTILRKNSDGSTGWSSVGKVGADVTTFTDETALPDVSYTYSVRSEASKNKGSYDRSGIEYIILDAPVINIVADDYYGGPDLSWDAVKNATHYQVFYRFGNVEWRLASESSSRNFSCNWPGVELMEFRVRATRDNKIFSDYSDSVFFNFVENKVVYPEVTEPDVTTPEVTEPTTEPVTDPSTELETTNPAA